MIGIFEDTLLCTMHANRLTVMQKDMQLANRIRNRSSWSIKWDSLSDTLLFVYFRSKLFWSFSSLNSVINSFSISFWWKKYRFNAQIVKTIIFHSSFSDSKNWAALWRVYPRPQALSKRLQPFKTSKARLSSHHWPWKEDVVQLNLRSIQASQSFWVTFTSYRTVSQHFIGFKAISLAKGTGIRFLKICSFTWTRKNHAPFLAINIFLTQSRVRICDLNFR